MYLKDAITYLAIKIAPKIIVLKTNLVPHIAIEAFSLFECEYVDVNAYCENTENQVFEAPGRYDIMPVSAIGHQNTEKQWLHHAFISIHSLI